MAICWGRTGLFSVIDLSVLIPARNERWLARTIADILENSRAETEIITVLDGAWADPPILQNDRVTVVYHPVSVGQRAATNEAARLARGQFIMKCDAHCAFGAGFDVALMSRCEPMDTVMPEQRNLHVFDWQCQKCGARWYMGPEPTECPECDNTSEFERIEIWQPKANSRNRHYCFDSQLHFQYWRDYKKRAGNGVMVESMSLLGACWMMHRVRYSEIGGLDERHGSWGQMGTEVACKTWLSGGRLLTNRATWFAHMFRTRKGFSFPYPMRSQDQRRAREHSWWLWAESNWEQPHKPLSWLLDRFWPIVQGDVEHWTAVDREAQRKRDCGN
jgi:glycosyltransferase involved in cell wall biosynthesis